MISFVVPAYNEELELPSTIVSIRKAAEGRQHEIIVVNDASTDATAEVAQDNGVKVISINGRQIAAARNAGGHLTRGDVLFFVDADTRINSIHVKDALDALTNGYSGGSARVVVAGEIPTWSRICLRIFCAIYFGLNLGAGAFLFTTRENFNAVGGFDERLFIGEEVYFSLGLRKLGRFKILGEPVLTSGRKLRLYPAGVILKDFLRLMILGTRAARSRDGLDIWYDGKRETRST